MESREYANKALSMIELYYWQFLDESTMPDNPIVRIMFYGTMITTVQESPLPDETAQKLLVHDLILLFKAAKVTLAKHILSPLN
jgi:hypothetical protein